MKWRKI